MKFAVYMAFPLSHSFIFFWLHFYHSIYGCMLCMLLFNFINYVVILLCFCILIVMFIYSCGYVCPVLCIPFRCVFFLCIVCV